MMGKPAALFSVSAIDGNPPSLQQAAAALRVRAEALDIEFGVVLTDPSKQLYCVRVFVDEKDPAAVLERDDAFADTQIRALGDASSQPDDSSFKVP